MRKSLMIAALTLVVAGAVLAQFVTLEAGRDPELYECFEVCGGYYQACNADPGTTFQECFDARVECQECCQLVGNPSWPAGLPPM